MLPPGIKYQLTAVSEIPWATTERKLWRVIPEGAERAPSAKSYLHFPPIADMRTGNDRSSHAGQSDPGCAFQARSDDRGGHFVCRARRLLDRCTPLAALRARDHRRLPGVGADGRAGPAGALHGRGGTWLRRRKKLDRTRTRGGRLRFRLLSAPVFRLGHDSSDGLA